MSGHFRDFQRLICLVIVLVGCFFASAVWAEPTESAYDRIMRTGTVRVGYTVWAPYQMRDPNTGEMSGLTIDYTNLIADLLGLRVEWVQVSGLGMQVEELKQGRYDIVANDGPYVFSTIKFIDFSNPLYYAPVYAIGRKDDKRFHALSDLNKSTVQFIGIDGDLSVDLAHRKFPQAKLTTLPLNTDFSQLMMNVHTKKADVVVLDVGAMESYNTANKEPLAILFPDSPVAVYPLGFSMLKGDVKLMAMINAAIAAVLNTNGMEPLLKKWLPYKGAAMMVAKPYAPL